MTLPKITLHDLVTYAVIFVSTGSAQLLNGGTFTKAALLAACATGAGAVVHSLFPPKKETP